MKEGSRTFRERHQLAYSRTYRDTVIRTFLQAGVDYRFDYNNEIEVKNEIFDIKDRVQAYLALRADHNDDFRYPYRAKGGLTFRFN